MTSIPVPAPEGSSRRTERHQDRRRGDRLCSWNCGLDRARQAAEHEREAPPCTAAAHTVGPWGQHRRVSSGATAKAALASVVLALAILQAVTAMGLYRRSGGPGLGPCTAGRSASRS